MDLWGGLNCVSVCFHVLSLCEQKNVRDDNKNSSSLTRVQALHGQIQELSLEEKTETALVCISVFHIQQECEEECGCQSK